MSEDSTELATVGTSDILAAFGNVGFGEFSNDVKFPYLSIAAKTSDLAVEGSPKYIEGLKPGFFFNSLTKRVYGKTIKVVIIHYRTIYKEYTRDERGRRGDFVRIVPEAEIATYSQQQLNDYTNNFLPSGNILDPVKQFHVVLPEFKEDGIMLLEFSRGSFKHIRNWGNMILRTQLPYPAHVWELTTGMMTNDDNQSWFSLGDNSTTFVKDIGRINDGGLLRDLKDSVEFVSAIINQDKMIAVEKTVTEDGPAF